MGDTVIEDSGKLLEESFSAFERKLWEYVFCGKKL